MTLNLAWIVRGASLAQRSGWALPVTPDGEVSPFAAGIRSLAGPAMNVEGEMRTGTV